MVVGDADEDSHHLAQALRPTSAKVTQSEPPTSRNLPEDPNSLSAHHPDQHPGGSCATNGPGSGASKLVKRWLLETDVLCMTFVAGISHALVLLTVRVRGLPFAALPMPR